MEDDVIYLWFGEIGDLLRRSFWCGLVDTRGLVEFGEVGKIGGKVTGDSSAKIRDKRPPSCYRLISLGGRFRSQKESRKLFKEE